MQITLPTPEYVNTVNKTIKDFQISVTIEGIRNNIKETLLKGKTTIYLGSTKGDLYPLLAIECDGKTTHQLLEESGWTIRPKTHKKKVWSWKKFRTVEVEQIDEEFYELVPIS